MEGLNDRQVIMIHHAYAIAPLVKENNGWHPTLQTINTGRIVLCLMTTFCNKFCEEKGISRTAQFHKG